MSAPSSERVSSDPHRPADHFESEPQGPKDPTIQQPKLGPLGFFRFVWRQLTSMRTALVLLLLLALASVPGSLVPQRSSDPNGVIQYQAAHPDTFPVLDGLGVFSTFTSPWFSAIYILLFVSLVGCIIPRTRHHLQALRARPPRTPVRLQRLIGYSTATTGADVETAVDGARATLKGLGYRVERYGDSISAERGYLRETGNLIFHSALVGILVTVAVGGGFGYTGQRVLVQGAAFTNAMPAYDSFTPGRWFSEDQLDPYSLRLDSFVSKYQLDPATSKYQPIDFTAKLSERAQGGGWTATSLKVNSPVEVGGTKVYLLGNGYAPVLTVRNPDGDVVWQGATPFLPQDGNLTSLGVIKVPDGLSTQLGVLALFYPDPVKNSAGLYASFSPYSGKDSLLTLKVYTGDLGLDEGVAVNAYSLNTDKLTEIAGPEAGVGTKALELTQGQTVDLPNGLGSIEFSGLKRFVSLDIHHDPTEGWVLLFAILVLSGLLVSLFIPRRRVWVKASTDAEGTTQLEYAGLARGEDPGLARAVAEVARRHQERLERRMTS